MITKRSISEKGQIVITKDMRTYLNWKNKENITLEIKDNSVIIKKEENEKFLEDFLNVPKIKRKSSWKKIKEDLENRHEIH